MEEILCGKEIMRMRKLIFVLLFVCLPAFPVFGSSTAVQTVKISVQPIFEIATFGTPDLVISPSEKETSDTGNYSITANKKCMITAHMENNTGKDILLFVRMQHPQEESYFPEVLLSDCDVVVTNGIDPVVAKGRKIIYRLVRTEACQSSVDVVYTICDIDS